MTPAASTLTTPPHDSAPTPADPARALIEEQLAMLTQLARIGVEVAEAVGRRAVEAEAAAAAAGSDPALVFARVARAVRMTIALQQRLMKDLAELDQADRRSEQRRTDARRLRLGRLIYEAAQAGFDARRATDDRAHARARAEDPEREAAEVEQAAGLAYERLKEAEDGWLYGLTFDQVIARVCCDLGVTPEWAGRIEALVAPPPQPPPSSSGGAAKPRRPEDLPAPRLNTPQDPRLADLGPSPQCRPACGGRSIPHLVA